MNTNRFRSAPVVAVLQAPKYTRYPSLLVQLPLLLLIGLLSLSLVGAGQPVVTGPDRPIDAPTRRAVVSELVHQLTAQYVFADLAAQMGQVLEANQAAGDYDPISSSKAFADTITAQLQRVAHDKHLRLFYQNDSIEPVSEATESRERAKLITHGQQINFGFGKPERLAGNVGYLRVDEFMPVELAAQTATAAMTYLNQTDALILDLRHNRGGEPAMVAFLASYFFADSVHLNDMVRRADQPTVSSWTHSQLPGLRYIGKPVYMLTSRKTFSAGEALPYALQSLQRAMVVGEPTMGGAHSGDLVRINEHFAAFIPVEYARNPVTQTNWEGTGVQPDLKISAEQSVRQAYGLALQTLLGGAVDADRRRELVQLIERVQQPSAELSNK